MKPGRELDALVAEKVMGKPTERYGGQLVFPACAGDKNYPIDYIVPYYSTDIAAAWEVVERAKLQTLARWREQWLCTNLGTDFHYESEYEDRYDRINDSDYAELADTAPHAICLAALKALGVEV